MLRWQLSTWCNAWLFVLLLGSPARSLIAQEVAPAGKANVWGVSASASSFQNHAEWFPKMQKAGVTSVRLFPEWRTVEPRPGEWNWSASDALVASGEQHRLEINGVFMGSTPSNKAIHAFPMEDLPGWSKFVENSVKRYQGRIRHWEVWNEGNAGFNDGQHNTTDYAQLAMATYTAAKRADAKAQVGLSVASYDAPYLQQTLLAMKKAGNPESFDFLCIHPYEIADGLADVDGEVPYLWMSRLLRDVLRGSAPQKADAEIWITEVGRRVGTHHGQTVTPQEAAAGFVKLYVMAIAQGIARVQWFEAQDPASEDQGFGLLNRDGQPRSAYRSLQTLTQTLGAQPSYEGWLALGQEERSYGFVFRGQQGAVLIAWMPARQTDRTLTFASEVRVVDLVSGEAKPLPAKQPLELTDVPVLIQNLPPALLEQARVNHKKNFPWGGDFSSAKVVSAQLGTGAAKQGIVQLRPERTPTVKFADGSSGILVPGDIVHGVNFLVHPSFASISNREYYVRVTARRVGEGNVGMNLLYEVADSQGKSPYVNAEQWFGVSPAGEWQTHTWHIKNACFAKMWGYDLVVRPEQSIPFVIGKIEVSTEPFK